MSQPIHCTICGCELTNGLDTYGDWDAPLCWTCWSEAMGLDDVYAYLSNPEALEAAIRDYWASKGVITANMWAADAERDNTP